MRYSLFILTFAIFPAVLAAQQKVAVLPPALPRETDPHQAQVQAATTNAMNTLRDQVLRTRLSRDLLVSDYLDRTASLGELDRVLKAAQPVGGARWVDDRTCQIRLELPESEVAAMLMGIAHSPHQHSPIRPDTLKAKFSDWGKLNFSVVGSSAGGDSIEFARPAGATGKWSEVGDAARKSTVAAARNDAFNQVIAAVGPVQLDSKTRAADALTRPAIAAEFHSFLADQPVTKIEFLDDLKVSVTISTAPKTISAALESAVQSDQVYSSQLTVDWDQVARQIEQLPDSAQGKAPVVVSAPATSLPTVVLPLQPPDWVDQQLEAESRASSASAASRLKVGHTAEADALAKIRDQFLLLHLDATTTLGDAAQSDSTLNAAVDRAMLQAHTCRVDYLADGSVKVRVRLDLRDAWDALRSNP